MTDQTNQQKTLTIDDKVYKIADLPEAALNTLNDISICDSKINELLTTQQITNVARQTFLAQLNKQLQDVEFVKVTKSDKTTE